MLSQLWKKKTSLMVGIDIGSHAVKAVLLSQGSESYVLENYAIEPMPRGAVVDREIQDIVNRNENLQIACMECIELANRYGGVDNITVGIAKVQ